MKTDLNSLATALYVRTDDLLLASPQLAPWRPAVGIAPELSDAELVTLSVMQALLGFTSERRFIRYARAHLRHLFPYLPKAPGYNKRLRKAAGLIQQVIRLLAVDTTLWSDDVWVVDSTPVECGRSRETVKRSDLAGWAEYGYCASHSRFFWGLRLHLVCTLHGLPIAFALTGAKADERETLLSMLDVEPELVTGRPGQTLIGDKNYFGKPSCTRGAGPAKRSTVRSRSSSAADAPPPCVPTAPRWSPRNCGRCSASTRPYATWPPRAPPRPACRPPGSASNTLSMPPNAPSGRTFPPRRLAAKIRDIGADLVRTIVKARPGRRSPRATKTRHVNWPTLQADQPATERVTYTIELHRLTPRPKSP